MVGTSNPIQLPVDDDRKIEFYELMVGTGATSPPQRFKGEVVVQLSGTATSITAVVEHATRNPSSGEANWAPADDSPITGNLSQGIAPLVFSEPASGFWRVNITALSGGNCAVAMVGSAG